MFTVGYERHLRGRRRGHRLARRKTVELGQLAGEVFVADPGQPGISYVPLAHFSPTCIAAVITGDRLTGTATRRFLDTLDRPAFEL
jgi:hypothetical protein